MTRRHSYSTVIYNTCPFSSDSWIYFNGKLPIIKAGMTFASGTEGALLLLAMVAVASAGHAALDWTGHLDLADNLNVTMPSDERPLIDSVEKAEDIQSNCERYTPPLVVAMLS